MFAGLVAPFAGTWIEIRETKVKEWEKRGVAPFAGAWIEIRTPPCLRPQRSVAPFAGAWIEMIHRLAINSSRGSLPSRERGLKYLRLTESISQLGRSLRGSVD